MTDDRNRNKGASSDSLPPWLRGVPLPARPPDDDVPTIPALEGASASGETSTLPDWLRDLQGSIEPDAAPEDEPADQTSDEQPDWLPRISAPSSAVDQGSEPSSEALPDWLHELSSSAEFSDGPPAASPPLSSSDEATPAWLRDLAEQPAEPEPPASPTPPPQSRSSSRPLRMPVGATDWLRSIGQEPDPADKRAGAGESSERSSAASGAADQPPDLSDESEDVPSWLTNINPDDMERDLVAEQAGGVEDVSVQSDLEPQVPNWLAPHDEPAADQPTNAMPDWLVGAELPPLDENETGLSLDWMREASGEAEPASEPPSGDIPDWLRAAVHEPSAGGDAEGTSVPRDDEITLPDWLRESTDTPTTGTSQLATNEPPAWLSEDVAHPESRASLSDNAPVSASDTTPNWLHGASQPPVSADTSDVPNWLNEADDAPQSAASEANLPNWLSAGEDEVPEVPAPPASSGDDLPDWLREVDTEPPPPSASMRDDVPDWLRDAGMTPAPAEAVETSDVPDWLRGMDAEPVPSSAPEAASDVPDWLRGEEPAASIPSPSQSEQRQDEDAPDWLREDTVDQSPRGIYPVPDEAASNDLPPWLQHDQEPTASSGARLPDWLRGAEASAPTTPPTPPNAPISGDTETTLPSWLRDEGDTSERAESQPLSSNTSGDFFGGADLPSWLRPSEPVADTNAAATQPSEPDGSDWLARLRLPEEETELQPSDALGAVAVAPRPGFVRTPEQLEAVTLLQRLIADPFPAPAVAPAAETSPIWRRMGAERLLYLLLTVAIIAGLLVPTLNAPFGGGVSAPDAPAIISQIDALSENDVVLVGYEWDARRRSELSPLEQAVMGHLAARKVRFVFVSTDLQGTILSFDARDQLINQYGYRPGGFDYILLGYRPGGELALRRLAQNLRGELASDFQGADASQSVLATDMNSGKPRLSSLSDFAMVLVMADEPQDVQAWMEQIHSAIPAKPFLFLLPAETQPVVQPYIRQPGVLELAGRNGALAYQQLLNGGGGAAASVESGQLPFAVVAFLVLLLVGALVSAVVAAATRGRRSA